MTRVTPDGTLAGVHVLIVEDDDDTRELFCQGLISRGATVEATATVDAALAAIRRARPNVILTDLGLGRERGTSLLYDLRCQSALRGVPVIAVTGWQIPRSLKAEFDGFMQKPVDADELYTSVARVLRRVTTAA